MTLPCLQLEAQSGMNREFTVGHGDTAHVSLLDRNGP